MDLTGLLAYWKMDEPSGNLIDSHGIFSGSTVDITYGVQGKINTAFSFNGNSSYCDIDYHSSLDLTTLSLSAWVKTTSDAAMTILEKKFSGVTPYVFRVWAYTPYFRFYDGDSYKNYLATVRVNKGLWSYVVFNVQTIGSDVKCEFYINGKLNYSETKTSVTIPTNTRGLYIGCDKDDNGEYWNGQLDEISLWSRLLNPSEISYLYNREMGRKYPFDENKKFVFGKLADYGKLPSSDEINIHSFERFKTLMKRRSDAGSLLNHPIVTTYSIAWNAANGNFGAVLSPNNEVHVVPYNMDIGIRTNVNGWIQTTYSLVYTTDAAYFGGILAPNGEIHFVPHSATVGQKVNSSNVVSTYTLAYTTTNAYAGGVVSPNGNVYFIPYNATVGQKMDSGGTFTTFSLTYTTTSAYVGGVLSPTGDIHFIPYSATVGQKISSSGVVSTYSLAYTTTTSYWGGVLNPNGDIHFVPHSAEVGQKIDINGTLSTYSLIYTTADGAYCGGVLSSNGDVHFITYLADTPYQRVSVYGIVSTYSSDFKGYCRGGVLLTDGSIYLVSNLTVGQTGGRIITLDAEPFGIGVCCSPFLNKL